MNKEDEAELKRRVDILWRGAYGDEDNEIPGFVDELKTLKNLEEKRTKLLQKAIYVGTGILGTLQFVFWLIEKLHIKLF